MTRLLLNDLPQPAWAAALHAARILRECNASDAEDRRADAIRKGEW